MRVVFNCIGCPPANNGGSLSVWKIATGLRDRGHDVKVVSSRNNLSWRKLDGLFRAGNRVPPCDVVIATGWGSFRSTIQAPAKVKTWWVRGWETWKTKESSLVQATNHPEIRVIANCFATVNRIRAAGGPSGVPVCYNGIDACFFRDWNQDRTPGNVVGFCDNTGSSPTAKAVKNVNHVKAALHPLVQEGLCTVRVLGRHEPFGSLGGEAQRAGTPERVADFVKGCDIWVTASSNESFHIQAAEAAAAGCCIVASDIPGTKDYLRPDTALLFAVGDVTMMREHVRRALSDVGLRLEKALEAQNVLARRVGTPAICAERFEDVLHSWLGGHEPGDLYNIAHATVPRWLLDRHPFPDGPLAIRSLFRQRYGDRPVVSTSGQMEDRGEEARYPGR